MSRQEDFQTQAETYANTCGGTTQEKCAIMTDYFAGAEHGYQYAKKSFFDALTHYCNRHGIHPNTRVELISYLQKAMEE